MLERSKKNGKVEHDKGLDRFLYRTKGGIRMSPVSGQSRDGGTISNMIYIFMTSIKEMSNLIRIREKTIFLCIKKVMIPA